ncbi:apolipoprotein O, a isoform X2 [Clupea harengus]|uniref:MICOS complex subunit n=1 Tax=Clupea harengus TaxID=7950 RepID=A0A6P8FUY8_CLUHA|nr:apolipoprotein O, a isoform X2 [Clupea harengus]
MFKMPAQGPVGVMMAVVFAATPSDEKSPSNDLSLEELSLYTTPQPKLRYLEPPVGSLELGVTTVRHATQPYLSWGQGVYGKVKPQVDSAVQMGTDGYVYLQNPPPEFYPRAGVIGFAGILGLFLARGSRWKKLVYPSGLMAIGASVYYPQKASEIAKATGDGIYDWALQAYVTMEQLVKPKPSKEKVQTSPKEETKA